MRLLLERSFEPAARPALAGHDLVFFDSRSASREDVLALMPGVEGLGFRWPLTFAADRDFLAACPELKHIHKSGSGLEHPGVLDLAALDALGILFSNNAGLNADVVAEHAILLTLLALRPATITQASRALEGSWDDAVPDGVPKSRTLIGKTVGIVGLGQIGTAIAMRMRGMGVGRILGYQRTRRFEHTAFCGLEWMDLDELLATAEIIVLALPITPSTDGLLSRERIARIRPDATLVNVGRGAVLDEAALYEALASGRIRAAGLDVLVKEPSDSPLLRLPNVVVTPHTAGTATEMQALQITGAIAAIADFANRRLPPRLFNPGVLATPQLRAGWLRRAG